MKRRKFFGLAISSSVLVTIFTGCNDQQQANTGNTPAQTGSTPAPAESPAASTAAAPTGEKKVLKLITSPDYPPYEYYDTSSGQQKIVGFDIDIAQRIADKLGYELKVIESDFNGIIPALQANRADFAMAGMTPTAERKKNVDFSQIYFTAQNTIIAKKGSNLKTAADLKGKKIGVQLGATQEQVAKDIAKKDPSVQIKSLNKVGDLIQEIKSGRINAAIIEDTIAKGYTQANPDLEFNTIPTEGEAGSAIAFPKGSPLVAEFDKVIKELIDTKEIDKLVQKWFEKK